MKSVGEGRDSGKEWRDWPIHCGLRVHHVPGFRGTGRDLVDRELVGRGHAGPSFRGMGRGLVVHGLAGRGLAGRGSAFGCSRWPKP